MTYYHAPTQRLRPTLPDTVWVQDTPTTGHYVDVTPEVAAAHGWYPYVDTPRPADTDTATYDRSVEIIDGQAVVVWTERPWTVDELAARTQQANRTSIEDKARAYLALDAPTAAQTVRAVKALLRLALNDLDSTTGT